VLGPNGAGKTTLIEILEGLLPATRGEVEVLGMCWADQGDQIRQEIGISLQETRLADKLTVLETLRLFRSFYRRGMTAQQAIEVVSLEDKSRSWVKHLSGGQQQRLAVAAALVGDPRLLFLDEPTTGLDPQSRRQLWEVIGRFGEQGRTVLLTTHYMEEAERLCDRVAIIHLGKIIALGSPRELIAGLQAEHIVEFSLSGNGDARPSHDDWLSLPAVRGSTCENGCYRLSVTQPHVVIPAVLERLGSRAGTWAMTRRTQIRDREGPPGAGSRRRALLPGGRPGSPVLPRAGRHLLGVCLSLDHDDGAGRRLP
jgi:ABC-2 type transport system ATP-binding protein